MTTIRSLSCWRIRWRDWPPEKIAEHLDVLRQGDVALLKRRDTAS
ncbi:MAG: hypothetical protein ABFD16_05055 [Thermoguttaceae bacterium]